ncbi:hypothetical protein M9Y10_035426 [Tritrichomonas musculus]|uniref:Uncharacterized protein n=1 Tax=Tritrichomonas musculus TaxID=1915356 RepID=A0ABR2KIK9_9EUKA
MTVYTSTANSEFKKEAVFSSNRKPGKPWICIQFPLKKPITGDRIKLEFNTCTENYYFTPNNNSILIQGLTDEYNELLVETQRIFTDYCEFELVKSLHKRKSNRTTKQDFKIQHI